MTDIFNVFAPREKVLLPAELLVARMHPRTRALRIKYYKVMENRSLTTTEISEALGIKRELCYQQLMIFERQKFVRKAHVLWGKTKWELV